MFFTKIEVATWYGISVNTLKSRLSHAGIIQPVNGVHSKKRLSPKQIIEIYEEFGEPTANHLPSNIQVPKLNKRGTLSLRSPKKKKK